LFASVISKKSFENMRKLILVLSLTLFIRCTGSSSDAWADFTNCATNDCVKEAIAVKDAFLKDPKTLLTQFQTTYEKGEDHVIGWLYMLRENVLVNPKMGTVEERLAMQKALIEAAKPFVNDPKVHEMAESVINELQIVDVVAGKINDPLAGPMETCYLLTMNKDTTFCKLSMAANGDISGFYSVSIYEKDGSFGIIKGKMIGSDTVSVDFKYMQEGTVSTEPHLFVLKENKLINLVSDSFDNEGRMILSNHKKLKIGETLSVVDCEKTDGIVKYIKEENLAF
jgi:hypothetical protein